MRNILVISLIFLCTIVFAQEEPKTSIKGGAKALIFEFDGLDNLSADSYEGGIGGKIFFNKTIALRVVLNFDRFSYKDPANPSAGNEGVDGEYVETTFGLGSGVEFHLRNKSRVSPYFGAGIGFSVTSEDYKPMVEYNPIFDNSRWNRETSGIYEFALMGVIGAELFILKEVSLSAEYMLNIGFFSNGESKYNEVALSGNPVIDPSYTEKESSGWMINTGSRGRLILSIYF